MLTNPQLAVWLDDLRRDVVTAMNQARTLGFRAIDANAVAGPISPQELSQTGRRHLLKHLDDLGLRMGSLRGPVGGPGYTDARVGEQRLAAMRKIMDLAHTLGVPVVSTRLGAIQGTGDGGEAVRLREVVATLADHADRTGVCVAVETASLPAAELSRLLAETGCPWMASCCDSGAMLMQGDDPHAVAETLPGRIRLVRARDAVAAASAEGAAEVRLGEGDLNVERFLAALVEAGFRGDIVLTRSTGTNPVADLQHALAVFGKHLQPGR